MIIAHIKRIRTYLCTYIRTKYILICTGLNIFRIVRICTYYTYKIRTPLLIKKVLYGYLYTYTYKIHLNTYRSEHIPYSTYLYALYVQDSYTIAHIVCICMYLCTYIQNTYPYVLVGYSIAVHMCSYNTYGIHTPLLIKYDNSLPSLKEREE